MIKIIADNILSPLGETTEANLKAVREGKSLLGEHRLPGMPESFVGSLFEPSLGFAEGLIKTITTALSTARAQGVALDITAQDVIFIISSTKGNIADFECIGASAEQVAHHFGNPNRPIVVSNACISGLSAQILAMRLLKAGFYRYAVVAGMDVQGKFIVSGFQSFKALSPDPCRPFDGDRCGLNLGEAAACMILEKSDCETSGTNHWTMTDGCVRNDAVHISNPSRTGEGSLRAIQQILKPDTPLACISAHGTATLYNDEMEAAAIDRAGLKEVPTFSLKGYYGHTMGAAGILETIITLHAAEEGWIPATRGYEEAGTSHEIHVTAQEEQCVGKRVMKLLSGFGGCNGAALYEQASTAVMVSEEQETESLAMRHHILLTPQDAPQGLTALYKEKVGDYPKFYKMDPLCKLGFLATELLLNEEKPDRKEPEPSEDRAVVLFCKHGSMAADRAYEETICNEDEYFPSPSVFVYTLSNIVTGEIAIRNHYYGETSCFILEEKDETIMRQVISSTLQDKGICSIIAGWVDFDDDQHYEADLALYERVMD